MFSNKFHILSDEFNDDITLKKPIKPIKNKKKMDSYISKLKKEKENIIYNETNVEIQYGWIVMQGNKNSNKITHYEYPPSNKYDINIKEKSLFNFRKKYISLYGVDIYNEMFILPYHDYNYFNRSIEENKLIKQYEEDGKNKCKCLNLYDKYRPEHLPYKLYAKVEKNGEFKNEYILEDNISSDNEVDINMNDMNDMNDIPLESDI